MWLAWRVYLSFIASWIIETNRTCSLIRRCSKMYAPTDFPYICLNVLFTILLHYNISTACMINEWNMDVEDWCDDTEETEVKPIPIPIPICQPQIPYSMYAVSVISRLCFRVLYTNYKEKIRNVAVTLSDCVRYYLQGQ